MFGFLKRRRAVPREVAERLVAEGNVASDAGQGAAAGALYRQAMETDPTWAVPYFNLGLAAKYAGRWEEALAFNQRAVQLDPGDEGAWWNLAIAATALGNWSEARRAWQACRVDLPPGDGPPDGDLGVVPIRLDPAGRGEVVWSRRVDLARARILNIPLPGCRFRFGDLVLTDGAGVGHRVLNGRDLPVFNVLCRLESSPLKTFVGAVSVPSPEDWKALVALAEQEGGAAEDWASSVYVLCKSCSEGRVDPACSHGVLEGEQACGIAAQDEAHLVRILNRWRVDVPGLVTRTWELADESVENG
jgi:tetratricopeptide (TPR) repeat protein